MFSFSLINTLVLKNMSVYNALLWPKLVKRVLNIKSLNTNLEPTVKLFVDL